MTFPIVALGASAGGLEALSELLSALPPDSELAYVIIQHLDPRRESLLPELLARKTAMPVQPITDGMTLKARRVYIIPPATPLSIEQDRLRLRPRADQGPHHPIDVFFTSLAEARGETAVGIVLSGGDADGTLGVRAIKRHAGHHFCADAPLGALSEHASECHRYRLHRLHLISS